MGDEHHDFTHTSMHCVCLENEVDGLRAEVTRLLCDNQTMRNALTVVIESGKHNDDIGMRELLLVSIGFRPSPSESSATPGGDPHG